MQAEPEPEPVGGFAGERDSTAAQMAQLAELQAKLAAKGKLPPTPDAGQTLSKQSSRGGETDAALIARLKRERDEAQVQAQIGLSLGPNNIKDRLEAGEWDTGGDVLEETVGGRWWVAPEGAEDPSAMDRSEEVNNLRTMARVRAGFKEDGTDAFAAFPRMVVVGDGNTGKSTVLNRFAQFNFSAVTDGICTKRPIRLELRALSVVNYERVREHKLDAICTVSDFRNGNTSTPFWQQEFELRASHRLGMELPDDEEPDEFPLRREVEGRASSLYIPPPGVDLSDPAAARAAHDETFLDEELVIRYEARGMIHFDLVDLPGVQNSSPKTDELVKNYVNKDTLDHTFMLIFQGAGRGDTNMEYSICLKHINAVAKQAEESEGVIHKGWMTSHVLGVLTMFDKKLENDQNQPAAQYNQKYAEMLRDWLLMTKADGALIQKKDWVTVLNPNPEEQLKSMSFGQAIKKEQWFYDHLLRAQDNDSVKGLCGLGSFRSTLVLKYELFSTNALLGDADAGRPGSSERVFAAVNAEKATIQTYNKNGQDKPGEWGWEPDEERYDDPEAQRAFIKRLIQELMNAGNVFTPEHVLQRREVVDSLNAAKEACTSTLRNRFSPDKAALMKPVQDLAEYLKKQVNSTAARNRFRRFPLLTRPVQQTVAAFMQVFVAKFGYLLDEEITRVRFIHDNMLEDQRHVARDDCVSSLVVFVQKNLVNLATLTQDLPEIPDEYLSEEPPDALQHTRLITLPLRKDDIDRLRVDDQFVLTENLDRGLEVPSVQMGASARAEPEPEPEPSPRSHSSSRTIIASGSKIIKVNSVHCKTQGGVGGLQRVQDLVADNEWAVIAYVESSRVVADHVPAITNWLRPDSLLREYKKARDRFMRHRRAAELLVIVFDAPPVPNRAAEKYTRLQRSPECQAFIRENTRALVRLGKFKERTSSGDTTASIVVTIDAGPVGFAASSDLTVNKVTEGQACAHAAVEVGMRVLNFQGELLGPDETWVSLRTKVKATPKPWRFTFGPPLEHSMSEGPYRGAGLPGDSQRRRDLDDPDADPAVDLPGFCCTPGCKEPHEAFCNPCGHSACCWECLAAQETCPVCAVPITDRRLCYPDNYMETRHTQTKTVRLPEPEPEVGMMMDDGDTVARLPEARPPERSRSAAVVPGTVVHTLTNSAAIGFDCDRSWTVITVHGSDARTDGIACGMQLSKFKGGAGQDFVWTRELDRAMTWIKMRQEMLTEAPLPWAFTFVPGGTHIPEPEPEPEPEAVVQAPRVAYALTTAEMAAKKVEHKRDNIETCMRAGCGAELTMGNRHHCKCCGLYCCTSCSCARKKLIFKSDEATANLRTRSIGSGKAPTRDTVSRTEVAIERKFKEKLSSEWMKPTWQTASFDEAMRELAAIQESERDKTRPYQLRVKGQTERTFPTADWARQWLEEVVMGDEEDHSWERVCITCREPILGLEIPI